jgi:cytochrome c6
MAPIFAPFPMRRLFSLLALCLAMVLGAAPSLAADAAHGGQIFSANCAACHMGGGNVVNAERTLKQEALTSYLENYAADHEAAIAYQVTNGKNAMPAFGGKLSDADIADVAAYVEQQSSNGWS